LVDDLMTYHDCAALFGVRSVDRGLVLSPNLVVTLHWRLTSFSFALHCRMQLIAIPPYRKNGVHSVPTLMMAGLDTTLLLCNISSHSGISATPPYIALPPRQIYSAIHHAYRMTINGPSLCVSCHRYSRRLPIVIAYVRSLGSSGGRTRFPSGSGNRIREDQSDTR
jgi:hypothetical protein